MSKVIIKSSFLILITLYGFGAITAELIYNIIPIGIVWALGFIIIIYFIRIPAPAPTVVETILGKDLNQQDSQCTQSYVMKGVAHRGALLDAPENTIEAYKLCNDKGCTAIEFDVKLTKDGVPIIFHDETLERLTDKDIIVEEQDWCDIRDINIAVKHPFRDNFPECRIPTLEETINQLLSTDQHMFIDLKDNNTKLVPVVLDLFKKHQELYSRAAVTTFYPNLIYRIRRANPKIVCCISWRPHFFAYHDPYNPLVEKVSRYSSSSYYHYSRRFIDWFHGWMLPRITYYVLGLSAILMHKDSICPQTIAAWRDKGVRVIAWTVNHPVEKQHFARILKIAYLTDTLTGESSTHLAACN